MKKIFLAIFLAVFASADAIRVNEFEVDVYSKMAQGATKKMRLNLELIGNDLNSNEAYVLDALNVIIGSFYAEDLLTSLGKEKFKEAYIKYAAKKHGLTIDDVLIIAMKVVEKVEIEDIINAIKMRDLCGSRAPTSHNENSTRTNKNNSNNIIISPNLNDINRPIDLNSIENFGSDFGEP
ncbi:hypothetical protein [Campylobacter suis]|uniref:Periplasmic protein n=1 Tax=Campylobacter suis TaxID=2790657 RepID=A0ABM8Q1G6_9BACT|nr:hypothetical protein [Campylobacter suis]CAD7286605.1 hypothetical protein LMG8286_00438 [Campylobacter suis]